MEFLREIHRFALPIPIVGHYLVLLSALLFLWSLVFLARPVVPAGFVVLLRVTWLAYALNALAGIVLAVTGGKVPSAVSANPSTDLTITGYLPDPSRHWEHLMYGGLALTSLIAAEVLISAGRDGQVRWLRLMPVATLFLVAVAYRAIHVAYLPGSTPGT